MSVIIDEIREKTKAILSKPDSVNYQALLLLLNKPNIALATDKEGGYRSKFKTEEGWFLPRDIYTFKPWGDKPNKGLIDRNHMSRLQKDFKFILEQREVTREDKKNKITRSKTAIRIKRENNTFLALWLAFIEFDRIKEFMMSKYYFDLFPTYGVNYLVYYKLCLETPLLEKLLKKGVELPDPMIDFKNSTYLTKFNGNIHQKGIIEIEALLLANPRRFVLFYTDPKAFNEANSDMLRLFYRDQKLKNRAFISDFLTMIGYLNLIMFENTEFRGKTAISEHFRDVLYDVLYNGSEIFKKQIAEALEREQNEANKLRE